MGTPVDFGSARKEAEDAGLLGGGSVYKLKEGDNRIRLMSACLPHADEYQGKKNFKWLCYVLDRRDAKLKPFFMPHTIYKAIEALQVNPDYAFAEVPMAYDLTVHAKKAGTVDVEYSLIPARHEVKLTEEEEQALMQAKPIEEIQQAVREKKQKAATEKTQAPAHTNNGQTANHEPVTHELTDDEIPF